MKLPRHLRAVFALTAAVALAGCATSPKQGCEYRDQARAWAGVDAGGRRTDPLKKTAEEGLAVVTASISAVFYGYNSIQCDKLTPTNKASESQNRDHGQVPGPVLN